MTEGRITINYRDFVRQLIIIVDRTINEFDNSRGDTRSDQDQLVIIKIVTDHLG